MKRILLCAALAACGEKADVIDWQRMKVQAKAVPYRDTEYFADGRVLQTPPTGTIARERALAPRPGLTEALLARGRERFDIFCAACHGVAGDGDSMVAANMTLRKPPSLLDAGIRAYADDRIFRVATDGWGLMPSYRTQMTSDERWAVVAYVRALQLAGGTALDELPADVQAEARARLSP